MKKQSNVSSISVFAFVFAFLAVYTVSNITLANTVLPANFSCTAVDNTNLQKNDSGLAVKELQVILNLSSDTQIASTGPGSPGNETGKFGQLTYLAVIKFQNKYASTILTPVGLTSGTGFVGTTTRQQIAKVCTTALAGTTSANTVSGNTTITSSTSMVSSFTQTASATLAVLNQRVNHLYSDVYNFLHTKNKGSTQTPVTIPVTQTTPSTPTNIPSTSGSNTTTPPPIVVVTVPPVTVTPPPVITSTSNYPLHTNITATTFWVGEIFSSSLADGSQVCSTYDSKWAFDWSGGVNLGSADHGTACGGAPVGGCDGISTGSVNGGNFTCSTEKRIASNGYFPTSSSVNPAQNPFYLDLPFDDINDSTGFATRCSVIPWAKTVDPNGTNCSNKNYSYMKNSWVKITGANGNVCYGQIEDAGPSHDNLYHDSAYVFGANNIQPLQGNFNDTGMDVSPALNGCLGFKELDGSSDKISWQFIDSVNVPDGPWKKIVTTSQVSE
jgi:hypothetical protein